MFCLCVSPCLWIVRKVKISQLTFHLSLNLIPRGQKALCVEMWLQELGRQSRKKVGGDVARTSFIVRGKVLCVAACLGS